MLTKILVDLYLVVLGNRIVIILCLLPNIHELKLVSKIEPVALVVVASFLTIICRTLLTLTVHDIKTADWANGGEM